MGAADSSVAIRLGTTGTAEVKRDLVDMGDTGDAQIKRLARSVEKANDDILAAERRRAQATDKMAAITPSTSTQQIYQAGASTQYSGPSARDSAAALRELLDAQDRRSAQVEALHAKLDPLYSAQKQYDAEIKVAGDLLAAGAIKEAEHAAAVALSEKALQKAKNALGEHSTALGLNRAQFITAQSAVMRWSDSVIAGRSPLTAFALEAHKVGEVISQDDGGVAGGLAKLRALFSPTTVGIAAITAALAVGAAAWYSYEEAVHKLDRLSGGTGAVLGLTGKQLEDSAEAAAKASDVSVSTARDIETSYIGLAKSGDVLTGLTAITRDFAAATGQELKGAQTELGKAFSDPIKGAQELAGKYGVLTQAQVEHIAKLVEEGDESRAQLELLHDLTPAFQGAAENAGILERAWYGIKRAADDAFEAMGHAIDVTLGGGTKLEQLQQLTHDRDTWLQQTMGQGDTSSYDKKIAALQTELKTERDKDNANRRNALAQNARPIIEQYSGDRRPEYQAQAGALRAALNSGGLTGDERKEATQALEAYTHAIQTFVPAAEKANMVAAATAKVRQATTPATRAAAKAELDRVKALGEVVTAQNVQLRSEDRAEGFHNRSSAAGEKHAATLAREAESMGVAARGSLALADAYLQGGAAAVEAEARAKGATDATKKGIDVEAQARRQLAVDIAQQAATSAKAVAQLGAETTGRRAANDNMAAGKLAAIDLNRAMSDEAALRPLLILQTLAHGDALKTLTDVIERYRANLKAAHDEEGRSNVLAGTAAMRDAATEARADLAYAGDTSGGRERAASHRAALRFVDDQKQTGTKEGNAYVAASDDKADAEMTTRRADSAAGAMKASQDQLAVTQAEIGLVGKSADEHDRVIAKLQLQQQLAASLGSDYAKYAPAILAQADATEAARQKLQGLQQSWQELRGAGDQVLDTVLSPDAWKNWGDTGRKVVDDLRNELIRLAVLNPLKNLLLGESNPTIGGVIGKLIPHNASGTEDWSGGRTWINENGPEIADLPSGTRIYPAAESRRMMAAANENAGPARVELHLKSDLLDARIADGADGRIGIAAPGIAAGGAALGNQAAQRARRRKLGSRG